VKFRRVPYRGFRARRAVAPVIATIMILGITMAASATLWELRFTLPSEQFSITYVARAGLKIPTWGDHTDCLAQNYPQQLESKWGNGNASAKAIEQTLWEEQCWGNGPNGTTTPQTGNFSYMNASEIVFTSVSPSNIPLKDIDFDFLCVNQTVNGTLTTSLANGSLAAMTWIPGLTDSNETPAPNAPLLGVCGTFVAHGKGASSTLYNRMGFFVPITSTSQVLQPGDVFILYVHTSNAVFDPGTASGTDEDYHGAPPWCFTTPGTCFIQLTYSSVASSKIAGIVNPQQLLANIPIYSISGSGE
jgi:hypothetical protein